MLSATGAALAAGLFTGGLAVQPQPASAAKDRGAWSPTARLATGRADHTASLLQNGKVLVAGGRTTVIEPGATQPVSATASAELYDPALGAWSPTGAMADARTGHTASVLDGPACAGPAPPGWCGKVLVAGGRGPDGKPSRSAELYDSTTGSWRRVNQLATARTGHTATVLPDGRVLVAGGVAEGAGGEESTRSAELYDPAAETWTATASLGVGRYGHTATVTDGRVLAAGGFETLFNEVLEEVRDEPTASAELYDPAGDRWAPTGSLAVARAHHNATLLAGGRVLVTGGVDDDRNLRRSTELYDPRSGRWSAAAPMGVGHSEHSSSLLADGRVLVAGGGKGPPEDATMVEAETETALAEVYEPSANRWSYAGPLRLARRQHTATVLGGAGCASSCGKVLVVGGALGPYNNPSTPALSSSELYDPTADTAPASVRNLAGRPTSGSQVKLTFAAPGSIDGAPPAAREYLVKQSRRPIVDERSFARARALCGGSCRFSPSNVDDQLTLNVRGLTPRTTYYYALKARDEAGDLGALSNGARVTTTSVRPGPIADLRATPVSATAIVLSFAAAGLNRKGPPPAREYVVKQSREPISGERAFRRARSLCGGVCRGFSPARVRARLRLRITDLRPGTTYHYAVRARNGAGKLGPTSTVRARTRRGGSGSASGR